MYFLICLHSLLYLQRDRMVNIFGDSTGKAGPAGPPGPAGAGAGGLKEVIQWFPHMILQEIRKKQNFLTLLIESIPPEKDADVELSQKRVTIWKPFNDHKNYSLKPVDQAAGELKSLMPPENEKRYGIVFNKEEGNMYYMENTHTMFLTSGILQVLATMTFLVGVKEEYNVGSQEDQDNEEQFLLSDYRWTEHNKSADKFRGVSIIPKADNKFDLYLHGARDEDGVHRLKIGDNLEKDLFYTIQVCWYAGLEKNGFYLLYKDWKPLINKTFFQCNVLPSTIKPAFYLGGFNDSTKEEGIIKSKCFTGIISNLEIIGTDTSSIPEELLNFIRECQTIINDDWITHSSKGEVKPPASKKKKIL